MAMSILCKLLVFSSLLISAAADDTGIRFGVNYGRVADNLPPPSQVASLAKIQGIKKIKIFDADPTVLGAFTETGIRMVVTVPNDQIPAIAASQEAAQSWFDVHVAPFVSQIETILVGNEVLKFSPEMSNVLVPAMVNMFHMVASHGLTDKVSISTPHAMDILEKSSSSPPSNGIFRRRHFATLRSMLEFLRETKSFFMLNVYPYFAFREDKGQTISSEFALFQSAVAFTDPNTNLHYTNLLDAQLDAVYAAIQKLGYNTVRIVVGETGWPTVGGFGASSRNAAAFTRNLIQRTKEGTGTPAKPEFLIEAYAFALFNEDLKKNIMEQNFGMFYPNMTKIYPIEF